MASSLSLCAVAVLMPKHKCCQALNPRRQRGFIHCLRQANVSGGPRAPWAECLARPSTAHEDECPIWNRRRRRTGVAQAKGAAAIADAGSEGELPGAAAQKRTVQHHSGAPGLDRTADTRFRKHAEGVTGRSGPWAKVLHGPRLWTGSVTSRTQACWAVVTRLVGTSAAVVRLDTASLCGLRSVPGGRFRRKRHLGRAVRPRSR
jgi:hypothetical protein